MSRSEFHLDSAGAAGLMATLAGSRGSCQKSLCQTRLANEMAAQQVSYDCARTSYLHGHPAADDC